MKRILILLLMILLTSCNTTIESTQIESNESQSIIIDDQYINELEEKTGYYVEIYLGLYNGYDVWFQSGDSTAYHIISIAGYNFEYENWFNIWTYKDEVISLLELYYWHNDIPESEIKNIYCNYCDIMGYNSNDDK